MLRILSRNAGPFAHSMFYLHFLLPTLSVAQVRKYLSNVCFVMLTMLDTENIKERKFGFHFLRIYSLMG